MEEEKPTSMVYDHCMTVYNEMASQAREEDDGSIYEGHLTKLFAMLQMSTPYYTLIMSKLKEMGCVEQLRRGGGNSPSRWRLLKTPSEEDFKIAKGKSERPNGRLAAIEQRIGDLNKRINNQDEEIKALRYEIGNLKQQLKRKEEVGV